jgi:hypothetical protein
VAPIRLADHLCVGGDYAPVPDVTCLIFWSLLVLLQPRRRRSPASPTTGLRRTGQCALRNVCQQRFNRRGWRDDGGSRRSVSPLPYIRQDRIGCVFDACCAYVQLPHSLYDRSSQKKAVRDLKPRRMHQFSSHVPSSLQPAYAAARTGQRKLARREPANDRAFAVCDIQTRRMRYHRSGAAVRNENGRKDRPVRTGDHEAGHD